MTAFNALENHSYTKADNKEKNDENNMGMMHSYYMHVIPNDFSWFMHWINSFQYTVTHHSRYSDDNGILFMFELSPITVRYFKDVPNLFDFMVQISSIAGGVFMFLRVIDMYLFNLWAKFFGGN